MPLVLMLARSLSSEKDADPVAQDHLGQGRTTTPRNVRVRVGDTSGKAMAHSADVPVERSMQSDAGFLVGVMEEHLDEVEFLLDRFEVSLSAADLTLDQVADGVEGRLLAHADALVMGGAPVVDQILAPTLESKKVAPSRVAAALVALLLGGRAELATRALWHKAPAIAHAALRACSLASGTALDAWIAQRLALRGSPAERIPLLELAADRGLAVPSAIESLRSDDPREIAAALRTLYRGDSVAYEPEILALFEHPEPLVRDAALIASLHHGSLHGWAFCQTLALDATEPHPLAMTLLSGLGDPGRHKSLAQQLDSSAHRPGALRALGYSGNVGLIPLLAFHVHATDERTARLAGEAIATIAGDEVNAFVRLKEPARAHDGRDLPPPEEDAEARRALPPLEEDDLDADLVPLAEATLPALDASAVSEWWNAARGRFRPDRRYVGGLVATRGTYLQTLAQFPMRRRFLLSLLLSIRTAGEARISTRALSATQQEQIAAIAAKRVDGWTREFSLF